MIRILINATQKEELRIAAVNGQNLINLSIENRHKQSLKSNIYQGIVGRVENSLEACFINYGTERHGFLPFREVAKTIDKTSKDGSPMPVNEYLSDGQKIIVQVEKEERGNKGAALTTDISLAGRFLVLKPLNPKSSGISRKINNEERKILRQTLNDVKVPKEMGVIIRTAGLGRSAEELQWDLDYQVQIYNSIKKSIENQDKAFLIYKESDIIIKTLRDNFHDNISEILIDDKSIYEEAKSFVKKTMPNNLKKIKYYTDKTPLFNRFQLESQIETAFSREVVLPSGGEIVIDHTEAMISIDINSARANKGADIEETAVNTNLEAADEIARQMRLRDLGGLLVIDFIDMSSRQNQKQLEDRMRIAVRRDRARVQIGKISRFGLMEMSRQRLSPALAESSMQTCPRCVGTGTIRSVDSLSLTIIRMVEEEALKENTKRVIVTLPVNVATYILNEKRSSLDSIEKNSHINLLVIPSPQLETPHYQIERVKINDYLHESHNNHSYELETFIDNPYIPEQTNEIKSEKAAILNVEPKTIIPKSTPRITKNKKGFFEKLFSIFSSAKNDNENNNKKPHKKSYKKNYRRPDYRARNKYNNHKPNSNKTQNKVQPKTQVQKKTPVVQPAQVQKKTPLADPNKNKSNQKIVKKVSQKQPTDFANKTKSFAKK